MMTPELLLEQDIYLRINETMALLYEWDLIEEECWFNEQQVECKQCSTVFPLTDGMGKCPQCLWDYDYDYEIMEDVSISECYFISQRLANVLIKIGEPVYQHSSLDYPVWGRVTSGQLVTMDGCIHKAVKMINNPNLTEKE